MGKCCIVDCENEEYNILLCEDHDAFSAKNINKPLPTGEIEFVYGDKPVNIIEVDVS